MSHLFREELIEEFKRIPEVEVGARRPSAIAARHSPRQPRREEGIIERREGIPAKTSRVVEGTDPVLPLLLLRSTAAVLPLLPLPHVLVASPAPSPGISYVFPIAAKFPGAASSSAYDDRPSG